MKTTIPGVEPHAATPLNVQIYERFRSLITQGRMAPGQRVPSLRLMAVELGVARGTVESAYDRLIGEGYLVARGPAGTFVAEHAAQSGRRKPASSATATMTPAAAAATAPPLGEPRAPRSAEPDMITPLEGTAPRKLQLGLPALDAFPRKLWSQLVVRHARAAGSLAKPHPAGHAALREALAAYLHRSRGVDAHAHQVFILPSYTAALGLVCDALLQAGDGCWVESPGFPPTAGALTKLGQRVMTVPVDSEGMDVAYGRRRHSQARLAVVTPSHQSPTGVSMTLARRAALLEWAAERGAWIMEDDYDGEYRYRGHPLPALKSLDRNDRVLYYGTLSKVLYPGLRLSYLIVPESQVGAFDAACRRSLHGGCPELLQAAAAEFIDQGHLARHIKRMRTLYARRRAMLADAFLPFLSHGLSIDLRDGGMHLLIGLRDDLDDVALARRAWDAGFSVNALTTWRHGTPGARGLLMSFTNVETVAQAQRLARELMAALDLPAEAPARGAKSEVDLLSGLGDDHAGGRAGAKRGRKLGGGAA